MTFMHAARTSWNGCENTVPTIQEPVLNCYTILTCGNGGIFSLLDLPNSLMEYNTRLGSKPETSFQ